MAGIYIHIPFCKQRCNYCAFYSSTLYNIKEEYADAVCKELLMRKEYMKGEEINTIYFGGGTPSTLTIEELNSILTPLQDSQFIEATIEANPDDLTEEYVNDYIIPCMKAGAIYEDYLLDMPQDQIDDEYTWSME